MIAWIGRRVRRAGRSVIRAVRKANDEQVYTWECVLLVSRTAPVTTVGPLHWVSSPDGYLLVGSHLPT